MRYVQDAAACGGRPALLGCIGLPAATECQEQGDGQERGGQLLRPEDPADGEDEAGAGGNQ